MSNKEEEHKEHIKKELERIGQKAPKREEEPEEYIPTALEEYQNYLDSLSDIERIEYLNILRSRAFFNPLKTDYK